ncbi:MAG: hypothetical protein LAT63_11985 [Marinobacter sp.]|nr:hypothetical protein [Marinobacter sp.]
MAKKTKSPLVKLVNAVCSLALFVSIAYLAIAGFSITVASTLAVACMGLAGPAVVGEHGILEMLTAFVEAVVEGVVAVVEAISSVISALFSGW